LIVSPGARPFRIKPDPYNVTAAYWLIARRIVEFEQAGSARADCGTELLKRLAADLTNRFGRGFGPVNLSQMTKFYLLWPTEKIFQTLSGKSHAVPLSGESQAKEGSDT
jgi:hypothetical protein